MVKKFEYKELGRKDIVDLAYQKRDELDKKGIKYPEVGSFTLGLNVLGKEGWELIHVNLFEPTKPLGVFGRDDELFYFKREI